MPSKGSGEIRHPDDENKGKYPEQPKKDIKPLKFVQDASKQKTDRQGILSSSSHPSELGDTPTSKLEGATTSEFNTEQWRQKQLEVMTDYWRKSGQLGDGKRKADELDLNSSHRSTKELRAEATQKLDDTTQIVEVSKENQPPSSLSSEQKAKNRRSGNKLPTDQMRHALGPIHNR